MRVAFLVAVDSCVLRRWVFFGFRRFKAVGDTILVFPLRGAFCFWMGFFSAKREEIAPRFDFFVALERECGVGFF